MPLKITGLPVATAMRAALRRYDVATFKSDAIAGLVVSLLALPLSMALAIAVGLPPRHGLYTAIVAGVVSSLFGGAMTQVTGPTAAFVVIVAPIVSQFGLHGIIWCEMMAGVLLVAMGFFRIGKLINYVPYPVVTGFTAGIAVTIATLALNDFLGLGLAHLPGGFVGKAMTIFKNMPRASWPDVAVGAVTLLALIYVPRYSRKVPAAAVAIPLGALLAWGLTHCGFHIATLNTRFDYTDAQGVTLPGIQPYPPRLHLPGGGDPLYALPGFDEFRKLFRNALVVAALAALESLLSATAADSMARTRHDPNAELSGIGLANIFSGLAMGIPATGAIARTATNIQAGAKTPVSGIIHALLILLYMVTLAPYISYTPMAALAALLLMTAWRMSHARQFVRIVRLAPAGDTAVLLSCFFLTVFLDMVAGVSVGMIMAALLFMKRIGDLTDVHISTSQKPDVAHGFDNLPEDVMVYRIEGPLFFGSISKTIGGADFISPGIKKMIIDLTHVPMIDVSGMMGMKTLLMSMSEIDRDIILCGPESVTGKILLKIAGDPCARRVRREETLNKAIYA
jgi:SulP family sulfate permease